MLSQNLCNYGYYLCNDTQNLIDSVHTVYTQKYYNINSIW